MERGVILWDGIEHRYFIIPAYSPPSGYKTSGRWFCPIAGDYLTGWRQISIYSARYTSDLQIICQKIGNHVIAATEIYGRLGKVVWAVWSVHLLREVSQKAKIMISFLMACRELSIGKTARL